MMNCSVLCGNNSRGKGDCGAQALIVFSPFFPCLPFQVAFKQIQLYLTSQDRQGTSTHPVIIIGCRRFTRWMWRLEWLDSLGEISYIWNDADSGCLRCYFYHRKKFVRKVHDGEILLWFYCVCRPLLSTPRKLDIWLMNYGGYNAVVLEVALSPPRESTWHK